MDLQLWDGNFCLIFLFDVNEYCMKITCFFFSKLFSNNIIEIHNITNNKELKDKPKFNMTTKDSSRKQIIILISTNNSKMVISQANKHISNINRLLKGVKSNVSADFICSDNKEVIITTNKVAKLLQIWA